MGKLKKRTHGSSAQIGNLYEEKRVQHGSARRKASGADLPPQNRCVESMKKPSVVQANNVGKPSASSVRMGIKVEMEHTKNPKIAEKIARDHLKEFPDYYVRLAKMEREAKKDRIIVDPKKLKETNSREN